RQNRPPHNAAGNSHERGHESRGVGEESLYPGDEGADPGYVGAVFALGNAIASDRRLVGPSAVCAVPPLQNGIGRSECVRHSPIPTFFTETGGGRSIVLWSRALGGGGDKEAITALLERLTTEPCDTIDVRGDRRGGG